MAESPRIGGYAGQPIQLAQLGAGQRAQEPDDASLTPDMRFSRAISDPIMNNNVAEFDRILAARGAPTKDAIRQFSLASRAIHWGSDDVLRRILEIDPGAVKALEPAIRLSLFHRCVMEWEPLGHPERTKRIGPPHERNIDHLPLIRLLLDAGVVEGMGSGSLLAALARKGDSDDVLRVAGWLLDLGATIERGPNRGPSALAEAAERWNYRLMDLLLARRKPSQDALDEALARCEIQQANKSIARLLELGANINIEEARFKRLTPPAIAAARRVSQFGEADLMRLLIRYKVDPNRLDAPNESPLMLVVHEHDLMQGLLDLGAKASYRAANGEAPLHWAVRKPPADTGFREPRFYPLAKGSDPAVRAKSVRILLAAGADANPIDSRGWTPLMYADPDEEVIIDALLDKGGIVRPEATLDGRLHSGMPVPTEIGWAIVRGNDPLALGLLKRRSRDRQKDGALVLSAAQMGTVKVLAQLLDQGATARHRDEGGWTPLLLAASGGHAKAVALLVEPGRADVNETLPTTNERLAREFVKNPGMVLGVLSAGGLHSGSGPERPAGGDSALIIAAREGHAEVVRELLKHGANAKHRNEDGETALKIAERNGHIEVVKMLKASGT